MGNPAPRAQQDNIIRMSDRRPEIVIHKSEPNNIKIKLSQEPHLHSKLVDWQWTDLNIKKPPTFTDWAKYLVHSLDDIQAYVGKKPSDAEAPSPRASEKATPEIEPVSNTPSREEFEARIEAAEARADARFIAFEKRVDDSMHRIELDLAPLKNIKTNVWGAAAAVIGTFVAVFAVYVTAFDSGRDTASMVTAAEKSIGASIEAVRQQQADTAQLLAEIRAEREAAVRASPPAQTPPGTSTP